MKILVIALRYDQGDPFRGDSFEWSNFYLCLRALQRGNHNVEFFPFDVELLKVGRDEMNAVLLEKIEATKPDLCFFSLIEDEVDIATLRQINKKGTTTLAWFGDDEWRFETHSKFYAPHFTFSATTYPGAIQRYIDIGYHNILLTAAGVNSSILLDSPIKKDIDVTFIGSWSKSREATIQAIRRAGITIFTYGSNWPGGRVSYERMLNLLARSKISLGLNTPSFYFGWRPVARLFFKYQNFSRSFWNIEPDVHNFFNNLTSWQEKKIIQMKARTFEVPARRSLLITQHTPHLDMYYAEGREIVVYEGIPDLVEKIRYFLDHDAEREAISEAGYQRTARDHTYEQRFTRLFAQMDT